jgi:hypothetical protein
MLLLTDALPHNQDLAQRGSSGCDKPAFFSGVTQYRFFKSSGKDRSYSFHLPSTYDANKAYPVVVGFHGSSSIGAFFELDTKMSEARYSGEKIMVYPNGLGGSWAGPTYHEDSTVAEDVQFVADVINDVKSKSCVDEEKVFGVGYAAHGLSHGSRWLWEVCPTAVGLSEHWRAILLEARCSKLLRRTPVPSILMWTDLETDARLRKRFLCLSFMVLLIRQWSTKVGKVMADLYRQLMIGKSILPKKRAWLMAAQAELVGTA